MFKSYIPYLTVEAAITDTVVLSIATASDKPREGIDFFPSLSVSTKRNFHTVVRFFGGFTRERKASENSFLTSRVVPITSDSNDVRLGQHRYACRPFAIANPYIRYPVSVHATTQIGGERL